MHSITRNLATGGNSGLSLFSNKILIITAGKKTNLPTPLYILMMLVSIVGRVGGATIGPSIVRCRPRAGGRRSIGCSVWWLVRAIARIDWWCWRVRNRRWALGSSFRHEILQAKRCYQLRERKRSIAQNYNGDNKRSTQREIQNMFKSFELKMVMTRQNDLVQHYAIICIKVQLIYAHPSSL